MLAGGLIISRRFVQVRTACKDRSTHISNYQSTRIKPTWSKWLDENPVYPQERFAYHKNPFWPALCLKRIGLPCCTFCYYYHYLLVTKYFAIKLICYLQFQHLQTLPYWKLLVISFWSSLGSTLLLIEKSYNWSPILVGHHWYKAPARADDLRVEVVDCA